MPSGLRKRVLLVANPVSGAGRNRRAAPALAAELGRLGIASEIQFTEGAGHGRELARAAASQEFDSVVAVGGDGTLREVADGLDGRLPAALYPTGTANVMARELAIPFSVEGAARVIATQPPMAIDSARANGQRALFVIGAGFDALVLRALEAARKGGISYSSYLHPVARTLLDYAPARLLVSADGRAAEPCEFALVSNTRYYAGPWVRFRPGPSLHDGRFEIYRFRVPTRFSLLAAGLRGVLRLLPGGAVAREGAARVRIESAEPTPFQIDGDTAGQTPVTIEVLPRSVPVLAPIQTQ
jgi:diacylglycerol kinase family enzyme